MKGEPSYVEASDMGDVSLEVNVHSDASISRLTIPTPLGSRTYMGASKRHPKDPHDPVTAELLATARALADAAADLEQEATRRIERAEARKRNWPRNLFLTADDLAELRLRLLEAQQISPPGSGTRGLIDDIRAGKLVFGYDPAKPDPVMDLWWTAYYEGRRP